MEVIKIINTTMLPVQRKALNNIDNVHRPVYADLPASTCYAVPTTPSCPHHPALWSKGSGSISLTPMFSVVMDFWDRGVFLLAHAHDTIAHLCVNIRFRHTSARC